MAAVLNAFNSGKKIQKRGVLLTPMSDGWVDINDYDTWDFGSFEYRIKPEKKVRPYTEQKQFLEDMRAHGPMLFHKYSLWTRSIKALHESFQCVYFNMENENEVDLKTLVEDWTWQDGHPCGIITEE